MKYPTKITNEMLEKISNVSDQTIERDIRDTDAEIDQLVREYDFHKNTTDRMESFRQLSRLDDIQRRQDFVKFLTAVMDKRKERRTNSILQEGGKR